MAKKKKKDEVIVDVAQAYSRTERYIEENKKSLTVITVIVVMIVGGYLAYKNLYLKPLEQEAHEQMWKAEAYFAVDSLDLAMNGDGNYFGFQQIIDEYGSTKAGNLAEYYVGVCYMQKGQFENAIPYLENYGGDDELIGPVATGAIGDCYVEMNMLEEGIRQYKKAAGQSDNDFTSPLYMMKAAKLLEQLNRWDEAKELYIRIQQEHPLSNEARNVDKYLARAKAFSTK